MTAPTPHLKSNSSELPAAAGDIALRRVGRACDAAIDGRRSARALAGWCETFELSEPEFQILWCLREAAQDGVDQTTLAKRLAFSPAQVSATVEKMRVRGWIVQQAVDGDRRRRLWQIAAGGSEVINIMLGAASELRFESQEVVQWLAASPEREAA